MQEHRNEDDGEASRGASGGERHRLREVAAVFLRLGCVAFGGPVAHLGFIRTVCVEQRRWLDDAHYADVVALCQFLPGPASSQVVFALGMMRAGLPGALAASLGFLFPSALIMIVAAIGLTHVDLEHAGWLHGLMLAAVAVVAQAVWSMGKKLCPDPTRQFVGLVVAAVTVLLPTPLTQIAVVALGAAVGWWKYRTPDLVGIPAPPPTRRAATAALLVCGALLAVLPLWAHVTSSQEVMVFDGFYRAGALVFGGGHVVLPLLQTAVGNSVDESVFLAGYGMAQALPGPLFAFAGFLGASIFSASPWTGGVLCLLAVFLPAWLLVGGALPFWQAWRTRPGAKAALMGANAAVVGVLLGALFALCTERLHTLADALVVVVALVLLARWKRPWLVVVVCTTMGELLTCGA